LIIAGKSLGWLGLMLAIGIGWYRYRKIAKTILKELF